MSNLYEVDKGEGSRLVQKERTLGIPQQEYKQDNLNKVIARKQDPRVAAAIARAEQIKQQQADQLLQKSDLDLEVDSKKLIEIETKVSLKDSLDSRMSANQITVAQVQEAAYEQRLGKVAQSALRMLGAGLKPHIVATALSVTPAYISQLMSDADFAEAVVQKKVVALTKANEHDENLNAVEELALTKLKTALSFTNKPMEIARVFSIVNNAKRRGVTNTEGEVNTGQTVVSLTLPAAARMKLNLQVEVNDNNQVVTVGDQRLGAIEPKFLMEAHRDGNLVASVQKRTEDTKVSNSVVASVAAARSDIDKLSSREDITSINLDDL